MRFIRAGKRFYTIPFMLKNKDILRNSITIGLTTYNAEKTVSNALKSISSQTLKPIEIIVVDDHSSDKTLSILTAAAKKNNSIRVLKNNKNQGVAYCRNKIINHARGHFLAFFDDDDISISDRLELQLKRILAYESRHKNAQLILCHTPRIVKYENQKTIILGTIGEVSVTNAPHGRAITERILLGRFLKDGFGSCATSSQMGRVSTYMAAKGFDINFRRSEDTELNIRLAELGCHFIGIKKPCVLQNMISKSWKTLENEYKFHSMLLLKHKNILDEYGEFTFSQKWLDIKYAWLKKDLKLFLFLIIKCFFRYPYLTIKRFFLAIHNIESNFLFSLYHKRSD
jgi:glycosyltransferase involved in cell wall biosynthesis